MTLEERVAKLETQLSATELKNGNGDTIIDFSLAEGGVKLFPNSVTNSGVSVNLSMEEIESVTSVRVDIESAAGGVGLKVKAEGNITTSSEIIVDENI